MLPVFLEPGVCMLLSLVDPGGKQAVLTVTILDGVTFVIAALHEYQIDHCVLRFYKGVR